MTDHVYGAGGRPLISAQYGGQCWPGLAPQLHGYSFVEQKLVTFFMRGAGVTELVTSDGWVVQLRIVVKAITDMGTEEGHPVHHIDFDTVPTYKRLIDEVVTPLPGRGN